MFTETSIKLFKTICPQEQHRKPEAVPQKLLQVTFKN